MSLREFTDGTGRVWRVWGTIPGTPHEAEVFAQSARLQAAADRRAAERQAREAERVAAGGEPSRRAPVSPGREHGWLTFQSGEEKRRLSPIPADWAIASDAELGRYLSRAEPVRLSPAAAEMLARPRRDAG